MWAISDGLNHRTMRLRQANLMEQAFGFAVDEVVVVWGI